MSDDDYIAPASLDGVTINFFDGFELELSSDYSGEGNEGGDVDYSRLQESVIVGAESDDGEDITGLDTYFPASSSINVASYSWVRTGQDSGTLTFTFSNDEIYPDEDSDGDDDLDDFYDMLWGGPETPGFDGMELVVHFLFTDESGYTGIAGSTSAHVYYMYWSNGDGTGIPFWSTNVSFTMTDDGSYMESGYNPYEDYDPDDYLDYVWDTLDDVTISFIPEVAAGDEEIVQYWISCQEDDDVDGPIIDGIDDDPEEIGRVLIDVADDIAGATGTYSYQRMGGAESTFAVTYTDSSGNTVTKYFYLYFSSDDTGTYTDSDGNSGTWEEDKYTDQG